MGTEIKCRRKGHSSAWNERKAGQRKSSGPEHTCMKLAGFLGSRKGPFVGGGGWELGESCAFDLGLLRSHLWHDTNPGELGLNLI